ncbi:MAG: WYL domain-containing protein, partial [Microbacterium sp.]
ESLLPQRLHRRVSALHSSVTPLRSAVDHDIVDPESLSVFAAACRDHEHVRFVYLRSDDESRRRVEPHQLVTAGRRWYLLAWDGDRGDWRTFRLDRISEPRLVGSHFTPRDVPGGDAADFVANSIGITRRRHHARLDIKAPFAEVEGVLRWADHTLIETGPDGCVVQIHSEDLGRLAMTVAEIALTAPVTVVEPAELVEAIGRLSVHLDGRKHVA